MYGWTCFLTAIGGTAAWYLWGMLPAVQWILTVWPKWTGIFVTIAAVFIVPPVGYQLLKYLVIRPLFREELAQLAELHERVDRKLRGESPPASYRELELHLPPGQVESYGFPPGTVIVARERVSEEN